VATPQPPGGVTFLNFRVFRVPFCLWHSSACSASF